MRRFYKRVRTKIQDPAFLQPFHGWSALAWFVAAFPVCIFLNQSLPFVVFISVYAIVVSHWEGWQSAGEMTKLDEDDNDE